MQGLFGPMPEPVETRIPDPIFLTIQQAARLLDAGDSQVRYAILVSYRLDAIRLGDRYIIHPFWLPERVDGKPFGYDKEHWEFESYLMAQKRLSDKGIRGGRRYADMPGKNEADPVDWYDLPSLGLPHSATVEQWTVILNVAPWMISRDFGLRRMDIIQWPEMYDYLVEREVVNLPIEPDFPDADSKQPELF